MDRRGQVIMLVAFLIMVAGLLLAAKKVKDRKNEKTYSIGTEMIGMIVSESKSYYNRNHPMVWAEIKFTNGLTHKITGNRGDFKEGYIVLGHMPVSQGGPGANVRGTIFRFKTNIFPQTP